MKISDLGGEAALINLIRDKYGAAGAGDLVLGIGDDAALIRAGESFLIVTADLLVENTHFRMDITEPYLLGWKSAAVNISDIAAMGGTPTYSFVSIGLPDIEVGVVESIYEGMRDVSAKYGSVLAGGDTVASDAGIVINVTQLGTVEPDMVARRDGAKARRRDIGHKHHRRLPRGSRTPAEARPCGGEAGERSLRPASSQTRAARE